MKRLSAPLSEESRRAMICLGKEPIESARRADRIARQMNSRHDSVTFCAYRCRYCKAWHIGTKTAKRPKPEPMTAEEEREWEFLARRNTWL